MSCYPGQIHFQPQLEGESPTRLGEGPGRPSFQCPDCPDHKPYSQKQGLGRHRREKHELSFECSHPGGCRFKWPGSRKYVYKNHLKKKHGLNDNEIEKIRTQPPRHRRSGDSTSVIESDRVDGHSEPLFSEEDIGLLRGYYKIHKGFPFPSAHPRGSTTVNQPRDARYSRTPLSGF